MTAKKAAPPKTTASTSLADYARDKRRAARRAACKVCAVPDEVREQMRGAREKKIDMRTIREWLERVHRIRITDVEYRAHGAGLHDQRDE